MRKQNPAGPQPDTDPDALERALHLLLEQISKRDQKISWITAQKEVEVAEKDALDAVLRSTQALLREREAQLHEILTSGTWKMAVFIQRFRTFLVPLHSRREAILQQMFRIVLSPFKKIRKS